MASINEARVRELVVEEARRLKVPWTAVDALVAVIKSQWNMHGHLDFFLVSSRRMALLEESQYRTPEATTKCLQACLNAIKNKMDYYFEAEIVIKEVHELE